ncbi:hypothetical protein J2R96_001987 [Bradyrhizobium elkanii]|nr:hypothetical protein [Bradyrhizobium elkanii]
MAGPDPRHPHIERGCMVAGTDVAAARCFPDACARAVTQSFSEYDFLMTLPQRASPGNGAGLSQGDREPPGRSTRPSRVHSVVQPRARAGYSVPCGTGRDGPPVDLQIVAPRLHDRPLLALARERKYRLLLAAGKRKTDHIHCLIRDGMYVFTPNVRAFRPLASRLLGSKNCALIEQPRSKRRARTFNSDREMGPNASKKLNLAPDFSVSARFVASNEY